MNTQSNYSDKQLREAVEAILNSRNGIRRKLIMIKQLLQSLKVIQQIVVYVKQYHIKINKLVLISG